MASNSPADTTKAAEYAIRSRRSHGGPLDRVCRCGSPVCPQQFLLTHIDSLRASYEALSQKFAAETKRADDARAEEREACAKLAEQHAQPGSVAFWPSDHHVLRRFADLLRQDGQP